MLEALFYDKNGKLVESIKFYLSDVERAGISVHEYLFHRAMSITKFYELTEKSPYCQLMLWMEKDKCFYIGTGNLKRGGKGDPEGYIF